jgi:(1->4)-alpha-D-glucan 1-alpha-D-glucosylmutase
MFERRKGHLERRFVQRLQQLTGPAMAKGVEDTALYRDVRLLALNEVGGNPARFALSVQDFHARQAEAQRSWPDRMLTLSTHDTKRSADVRARLVALAQDPMGYTALARDFAASTSPELDGRTKLLALQSLIGAWPLDLERLQGLLLKSVREAKLETRWTRPNASYEAAVSRFARDVLESEGLRAMLERYVVHLAPRARGISLAWALLQCACPGVPDLYQGNELWDFSLVDPDNRRPVDWARLDAAMKGDGLPTLERDDEGLTKLHVIRRALSVRRRMGEHFKSYAALQLKGARAYDAVAFARGGVIVLAALNPTTEWGDTTLVLPQGRYESALIDGPRHQGEAWLASLLEVLPVALLRPT